MFLETEGDCQWYAWSLLLQQFYTYLSFVNFVEDTTIAPPKHFGIAYLNNTRHIDCLSMCSIDSSCAALYYDRQKQLCHTTTIPLVYSDIPASGIDEGLKHARVKTSRTDDKVILEDNGSVAHGGYWTLKSSVKARLIVPSGLSSHNGSNIQ